MEGQSKGSREAWGRIVKGAKAHPGGAVAPSKKKKRSYPVLILCHLHNSLLCSILAYQIFAVNSTCTDGNCDDKCYRMSFHLYSTDMLQYFKIVRNFLLFTLCILNFFLPVLLS